jgi:hypothetical protein
MRWCKNCGRCGGFLLHPDIPCPRCGFGHPRMLIPTSLGDGVVSCKNCGGDVPRRPSRSGPTYCTSCGIRVSTFPEPKG